MAPCDGTAMDFQLRRIATQRPQPSSVLEGKYSSLASAFLLNPHSLSNLVCGEYRAVMTMPKADSSNLSRRAPKSQAVLVIRRPKADHPAAPAKHAAIDRHAEGRATECSTWVARSRNQHRRGGHVIVARLRSLASLGLSLSSRGNWERITNRGQIRVGWNNVLP